MSAPAPAAGTDVRQAYVFPASFAQRRMWFLHQLDPASPAYTIAAPLRLRAPLDPATLRRSLDEVVRRHESLRTTFAAVGGEPVQVVSPGGAAEVEVEDLRALPPDRRERRAAERMRAEAARPWDLRRGPLLRARVFTLARDHHLLLFTLHHIVSDGWSMEVLARETAALYAAFAAGRPSPLEEPALQYADFALWQHESLDDEALRAQAEWWRARLAGLAPALELPADRPRPPVRGSRGGRVPVRFDAGTSRALLALAGRRGATPYMAFLALFQALLHRYTGQDDVVVGSPVAGRTRPETEGLIGLFVNTVALRTDLSGDPGFALLLERVRETALDALARQDLSWEKVVEAVAPPRDAGRTPIVQVLFGWQPPPGAIDFGDARLEPVELEGGAAKFDLTLTLGPAGDRVEGWLEYAADLFEPETAARMAEHLRVLGAAAAAAPDAPLSTLALLAPAERRRLLDEWNGPRAAYPGAGVAELFEGWARRAPHAMAVVGEDARASYGELNRRANRLAWWLRGQGVGPEARVAVLAEPSVEMAVAVLAVLKAGGGYVPIDPAFPPERVRYILEDSGAALVLAQSPLRGRVPGAGARVVEVDGEGAGWDGCGDADPPAAADPRSPAYTIYTSGSTGRPKGVVVEQRQIVNYLFAVMERFGLPAGAGYAMLQPLAVDACHTVLYPALCTGGTLYVLPRERAADPHAVRAFFRAHPVDVLKIAPSHLAALLDASPSPGLLPRRVLALGGEGSRAEWLHSRVLPLAPPSCRVFIHYGPTETTVGVLAHEVTRDAPPAGPLAPLGRPLANTRVYVVDGAGEPVPAGVAGEIRVGGDGVARGYLGRPGLTADRFRPDPFSGVPGARLYRTGDLGRWTAGGRIEFLGRADHQVKVRGFRIELGEVEAAAEEHPAVGRAVVLARGEGGERRLAAYVVPRAGAGRDEASLAAGVRAFLRERLPSYMLPASIVVLDSIPLGPQGKIDPTRLPPPAAPAAGAGRPPGTPTEIRLARIWEEVLGLPAVGGDDDFFEVGGHSLAAVRMLARVGEGFGRAVPLADLFRHPTLGSLARLLDAPAGRGAAPLVVPLQPEGRGAPFFCVHPLGGEVACYAELARALGPGRPTFGIRAEGPEAGDATLEEMAARCAAAVRRARPSGPCLLGGWSMGGIVAWEAARQLAADGVPVPLLVLFDTHLPPRERGPSDDDRLPPFARFAAEACRAAGVDPGPLREGFLRLGPQEQRLALADLLRGAWGGARESAAAQVDEEFRVFHRNLRALNGYALRPLDVPVLLFQGAGGGSGGGAKAWAPWARAGLQARRVAADHYGILGRPHVRAVAGVLRRRLDRAAPPSFAEPPGERP